MNTFHLTSPDSSADNANDVMPSTLAVNQENAPLGASNVNVRNERATSVLPVLHVPDSPRVNENGAFEKVFFLFEYIIFNSLLQ